MRARLRWAVLLAACLVWVLPAVPAAGTHGGSPSPELHVLGHEDFDDDGDGLADPGAGSITDVWAWGDYAYVGTFDVPFCTLDETGVRIVDISDPTVPHQVGFIPSPPNTRANDPKVWHIDTSSFSGEILVVSNEVCGNGFIPRLEAQGVTFGGGQGGISIWDVSDPLKPRAMKKNFLKFQVHNTFLWQQDDRAYTLVVDDENLRDVHIVDVTKPWSPKEIAVTGAPDWPDATDNIGLGEVFLHDGWVQEDPEDPTHVYAYLSYWDLGMVILDVTDPANPVFVSDTDYPDPDPLSKVAPDGNSHVTVPSADGQLVLMGDEDFSPNELVDAELDFDGATYDALEADFTFPIFRLPASTMTGPVVWTGGVGCTPDQIPDAPSTGAIALIQRGVCFFQDKAESADDKGYAGFIVANDAARGDALLNMAPRDDGPYPPIPGVFVGHSTGEAMKTAPVGQLGGTVTAVGVFNGWGYLRVIDVADKEGPVEVGEFATEGVFDPSLTPFDGSGDRTMHNVVVDDATTAYISWYAEGMRVVDFSDPAAPTEIAHFVDTSAVGSNFWGVYLHTLSDGTEVILGSDRNTGLWIFEDPVATTP